nr:reverse transcriptase domain-containing protein [Tanacetum cinerariifolium]
MKSPISNNVLMNLLVRHRTDSRISFVDAHIMVSQNYINSTFYNALNSNDQDSLNSAAGSKFLDKMPRDCLAIIESKSKVRYSRSKLIVSKVSTSTSTPGVSPGVAKLKDMVKALLLDKKNQSQAPATIKAVEESSLADLGASINLMPLFGWEKINLLDLTKTRMILELADRTISTPTGIAEDVFVKVGTFFFPVNFVDVDYIVYPLVPLILERSFLRTTRALIDVHGEQMTLRHDDQSITFKVGDTNTFSYNIIESVNRVDVIDVACEEFAQEVLGFLNISKSGNPTPTLEPIISTSPTSFTLFSGEQKFEELKTVESSSDEPPELELKDLPPHLEYSFLEGTNKLPVIIAKNLKDEEKTALLKILMEDNVKPAVQHQRRVNPKIHEVIKKEVIKLLKAEMIYPISDSPWVIPVHCVPKKGGMTIVTNEENELIPTRLVIVWRVCIDYRKLNDATWKDHFTLPFMDQMLERLARNEFYCFLDRFSGYFQIPIDPQDQEKTTFTCPYGMFAYRRMPFGLCNASGTFQRCMIVIFNDMIEETMEVFMDDFSVFRDSFSYCLSHLDKMLKRCEGTNLVLNWEKCYFMVKDSIVLGHKISKSEIKVDKAKVYVIAKLPHPTTDRGIRSFLGHAGFCRRFIQDFSKISRPMTRLLEKETPFFFSKECIESFNTLKKKLTEAPILVAADWDLPFEIMCDANDFAVGAVLRQRKTKHFQPIDYASKSMTDAQAHYTATEKELLAVVYAFEKFRPYLVLSKTIVYTDHSAHKYLLPSKMLSRDCSGEFSYSKNSMSLFQIKRSGESRG